LLYTNSAGGRPLNRTPPLIAAAILQRLDCAWPMVALDINPIGIIANLAAEPQHDGTPGSRALVAIGPPVGKFQSIATSESSDAALGCVQPMTTHRTGTAPIGDIPGAGPFHTKAAIRPPVGNFQSIVTSEITDPIRAEGQPKPAVSRPSAAQFADGQPIVVFDLDNTLVHSKIDFLGIRTTIIDRLLGVGALHEAPANPRERAIPEWLDLAAAFDAELAADLWQTVDRFEREGMVHGSVEADAHDSLERLRAAGMRLAVLTNNSVGSAEAALERFELRALFELVLARESVTALKPAGDGVALAHARLGGGPTSVVGDSYLDGLAAQRARVGARFVAFRANPDDLAARGVITWASVRTLGELPRLLRA
jgi:phosphoglycolate phosphatase